MADPKPQRIVVEVEQHKDYLGRASPIEVRMTVTHDLGGLGFWLFLGMAILGGAIAGTL